MWVCVWRNRGGEKPSNADHFRELPPLPEGPLVGGCKTLLGRSTAHCAFDLRAAAECCPYTSSR